MSEAIDLQIVCLVGDGLVQLNLDDPDDASIVVVSKNGTASLGRITKTDIKRLMNRLKEGLDLHKQIDARDLRPLLRKKKSSPAS